MTTEVKTPYRIRTADCVVAGRGSLGRLGEYVAELPPARYALVLAQPSAQRSGALQLAVDQLEQAGIACRISMDIEPEPTADNIRSVYEAHADQDWELVVGIGGGSVLDAAKLIAVLKTNPMPVEEMLGIDRIPHAGVPMVLIPTSSGTGAEVTPNSIVTLPEQQLKVGAVSRHLLPQLALLDPCLTVGLPPAVTAAVGMDAFTHAFESYISNKANPLSDLYALEGIRRISRSIEAAYRNGDDLDAREDMLLGSMYGGLALSSAGTAAVHAMAYPLGGRFGIAHGTANAMLLPHVTAFNLDAIQTRMADVAAAMGYKGEDGSGSESDAAAAAWCHRELVRLTAALAIPQRLAPYGVTDADIPGMAVAASEVKRLMGNNPKPMPVSDIEAIYRRLL